MLKIDDQKLAALEEKYLGIRDSVIELETAVLPECSICGSGDTGVY